MFLNLMSPMMPLPLSLILEVSLIIMQRSVKVKVLVDQSCLTLCDPSLPGSSVHGILQAKILDWVAILFSKGFSHSRDGTWVFCIAGRFFDI